MWYKFQTAQGKAGRRQNVFLRSCGIERLGGGKVQQLMDNPLTGQFREVASNSITKQLIELYDLSFERLPIQLFPQTFLASPVKCSKQWAVPWAHPSLGLRSYSFFVPGRNPLVEGNEAYYLKGPRRCVACGQSWAWVPRSAQIFAWAWKKAPLQVHVDIWTWA